MIIQIDESIRISGSERCWELQRLRKRNGAPHWEAFKWFNSFGSALEAAVQREIRLHPAQGLSEAIEAVSGIVRKYEKLIPTEHRVES